MRRPDVPPRQLPLQGWEVNGNFVRMAAVGGPLAAPWGITLAPANFGPFSGDLLVGNFTFVPSVSDINAFDPLSGTFDPD
jgi:hypothetical protein